MIYTFSGTGNTCHVADLLASILGMQVHRFTAAELRSPATARMPEDSDKRVIWAFPTYSWGVPPVVRRIIARASLNCLSDAVHIAVTTCGDDIGHLPEMFRRDIRRRGLTPGAVFSVQMPNTYVMMKGFDVDAENVARLKIQHSRAAVENIAMAISSGKVSPKDDIVVRGKFGWLKTRVVYSYFVRFEMSPKGFRVDSGRCIACGKCRNACPMNNVTTDADGRPVWGDKCAFCTACYHVCPVHAISWKKTTLDKGQVRYFLSR